MGVKQLRKSAVEGDILVTKIPLRLTAEQKILVDRLRMESARLWNDILDLHWWLFDSYKVWSSASEKKKWFNATTHKLHSQTIQAIIELHEETCDHTRELRSKGETDWKYPWKYKSFFSVRYKKSALSLQEEGRTFRLSNGMNEEALLITFPKHLDFKKVKNAEIVWSFNQYWLHLSIEKPSKSKVVGDKIAGGDLGEIHAITLSDSENHQIITGKEQRSLNRLRNKRLRWFQKRISRSQKGSKSRYKLIQKKQKFLAKIERKSEYLLHSISKMAVDWCVENGVNTLYIGNPNGVQTKTRKTRRVNRKNRQKLSNWSFGRLINLIEYKAKLRGIKVHVIEESYTSGTCPSCGEYSKQSNRNYCCRHCGEVGHRDVVGAVNIREKGTTGELKGGRVLPLFVDTTYRRVKLYSNQNVA